MPQVDGDSDLVECAHPDHDHLFEPSNSQHRYKSAACRKDAWRYRKRQAVESDLEDAADEALTLALEHFQQRAAEIFDEHLGERL